MTFSKFTLSLRYRIALVIFVLEVFMLAAVLGIALTQSRGAADAFNQATRKATISLLSNLSISALLTGEYSDYQLYIQDIQQQPAIDRIVLANDNGLVMADSEVGNVGLRFDVALSENETGWVVQQINTRAGYLGVLAVKFSEEDISNAYRKTRNQALLAAVIGLFAIAAVGLATGFALTRRLLQVSSAAARFSEGDYSVRSPEEGKDEIALLSSNVNRMAEVISENEQMLSEQTEYIQLLLDSTSEAIYGVDKYGICTFVNSACLRMLGYRNENDLIGNSIHEMIHHTYPDGKPYPKEDCRVRIATLNGQATHVDYEVHWRADGSSFPVEYWSQPMYRKGALVGTVVTFIDISERKEAEEKIKSLAYFDPLTNLPNRRLLMDRLQQSLVLGNRNQEYGALLMLDLDNFKQLNDTQGHDVGDRLLQEVARRLLECAREEDTVSRLGGDEYVVLVERLGIDRSEAINRARSIAEKIHSELNLSYDISEMLEAYHCSSSIGVTLFKGHELSVEVLLKQADVALYQAKGAGRNEIRFFNPEMQSAIELRSKMENAMREGLKRNEFKAYYQPQVDHMGNLIGAESLLRWIVPGGQFVLPDQFIPLAEDTGLIIPMGVSVIEAACAQISEWDKNDFLKNIHVAVNVSAKQFHQSNFISSLHECLQKSGIRPELLQLELTESVVLRDIEDVIEKMRRIKALGVSFSLDDFGTGYSSLSYLKRLPFDQVKIDQSFVHDIAVDSNDAAIVRAIIAMCQSLDMQVIAEGVETVEQFEFLKENGCWKYQGYLFGKPLPIEEFTKLIKII